MQRPPFPAAFDNTMRSALASCKRKGYLRFFLSWQSPYPSIDLHAGICFAAGLELVRKEYFQNGTDPETAIALGWQKLIAEYGDFDSTRKPNKSAARMGHALVSYFDEYPLGQDEMIPASFNGKPAVEFNFAIPLPIPHPVTGEPIIYCGRFDMLAEARGMLYVLDEKTTGSLGEYWAKRYELSSQFTGYCWGARQYGFPVVGAIIRGIGILSKEIRHAAMPFMRDDYLIQEWYTQLLKDIHAAIRAWHDMKEDCSGVWSAWEPNLADACGAFGGCEYLPVCGIAPQSREKLLQANFVIRPWEPLRFKDDE